MKYWVVGLGVAVVAWLTWEREITRLLSEATRLLVVLVSGAYGMVSGYAISRW